MDKKKKALVIDAIEDELKDSSVGILVDYRGVPTPEINTLRNKLRSAGDSYKVVKNSLAGFAADKTGKASIKESLKGPMAIAFGKGDASSTAKIVTEYVRDAKNALTIKGGFLGTRVMSAADVETLAILPSREILLARVLGQMQAPITSLASSLASPMRGLAQILQGRINQMEGK